MAGKNKSIAEIMFGGLKNLFRLLQIIFVFVLAYNIF